MKKYFLCAVVLLLGLIFVESQVLGQQKIKGKDPQVYFEEQLSGWLKKGQERNCQNLKNALLSDLQNVDEAAFAKLLAALEKLALNEKLNITVRYNAVILAGELQVYKENSDGKKVPEPYFRAITLLKKVMQLKGKDSKVLQVAALKGLAFYASKGKNLPEKERTELAYIFKPYAEKALDEDAPEVIWARIVSLEALGNLGIAGKNGEIAKLLLTSLETLNPAVTQDLDNITFEKHTSLVRWDIERRLAAASAFAKFSQSDSALLKAVGKKQEEILEIYIKFYLQCMNYECLYDYDEQTLYSAAGADGGYGGGYGGSEDAFRIRFWKQRIIYLTQAYNRIFNLRNSSFNETYKGKPGFNTLAKALRENLKMYESLGKPKRKRPAKKGSEEEAMPEPDLTGMTADADNPTDLKGMRDKMYDQIDELLKDINKKQNYALEYVIYLDMMMTPE